MFSAYEKNTTNIDVNPTDITSADDINELKAQMLDMQMEIDLPSGIDYERKNLKKDITRHFFTIF